MWKILGVLLTFSAYALDPIEHIKNVSILKTYPDNIVLLNRGLEDGIQRNDHAKLSQDSLGYSSRALCLKVEATESTWKVYRVPYAEVFSKDFTYTLSGMADKEISFPIDKIRDVQAILDKDAEGSIKSDLPQTLETEAPLQKKAP